MLNIQFDSALIIEHSKLKIEHLLMQIVYLIISFKKKQHHLMLLPETAPYDDFFKKLNQINKDRSSNVIANTINMSISVIVSFFILRFILDFIMLPIFISER